MIDQTVRVRASFVARPTPHGFRKLSRLREASRGSLAMASVCARSGLTDETAARAHVSLTRRSMDQRFVAVMTICPAVGDTRRENWTAADKLEFGIGN